MTNYTSRANLEQRDDQTNGGHGSGNTMNVGKNSNMDHSRRSKAPNGGWGWIVTFLAFLMRMLIEGITYSSGFFFIAMRGNFEATNSQMSWAFSVLNGTYPAIGPIVSIMIALFDWRPITIFGSCLVAISFFACTWSPNVVTMIVLYGLIGGIGIGFMYVPAVVYVCHYFTTRRSLAIGISACGSGIGGLVFAPLVEFLIDLYGWRGAMWIVAATVLHGIPIGILLRPLHKSVHTKEVENVDVPTSDEGEDRLARTDKQSCCNIHSVFDFELFYSPTFLLYETSCFFCVLGIYIPLTYLPDYTADVGHTSEEAAWLIATVGILNTISRALVGWLAERPWNDVIIINSAVLMSGGIATICVRYYHSLAVLVVYSAVFGVTLGVFVVMKVIIITELLGVEKLTSSFGLANAANGFAAIIGVPIAGALVDWSGDTVSAFYWAGSVLIISGIICLPLRRVNIWERGRKSTSVRSMVTDDNTEIVYTETSGTL